MKQNRHSDSQIMDPGIEAALIQAYSGYESRQSLDIYSKLAIGDAQDEYENVIQKFPV